MKNLNLFSTLLILCFFISFIYYIYKKFIQIQEIQILKEVYPELKLNFLNTKKIYFRFLIRGILLILLLVSILNPSFEKISESEELESKGIDILFLVDVSLSMNAIDISPTRLDKFKISILSALKEFKGNRLGLIVFANSPFLYSPLTSDLATFEDFVKGIDVNMISNYGTNVEKVISKANEILKSSKVKRNRLVVIVTDGEDIKGGVGEKLDSDVIIWGVGTEEGSPIYYKNSNTNQDGFLTKKGDLIKEKDNSELVISKLDKEFLYRLASNNNADLVLLANSSSPEESILKKISSMEKNTNSEVSNLNKKDGYQYFLFFAIILILFDMFYIEQTIFKRNN